MVTLQKKLQANQNQNQNLNFQNQILQIQIQENIVFQMYGYMESQPDQDENLYS